VSKPFSAVAILLLALACCPAAQAQYFTRILADGPVPYLKGIVLRQAVGKLKAGDSVDFAIADWNGDGRADIMAGSCYGDLMYFARRTTAVFAPPSAMLPVPDVAGPYTYPYNPASPELCDWTGHGRVDLLLGVGEEIYLYAREGSGLAPGVPLRTAGGETLGSAIRRLSPTAHHLAPCVADFDGDGLPDILIGDDAGCVWWVKNSGRPGQPSLATPRPLAAGGRAIQVNGRARVTVGDVNGDKILDIIIGDAHGNLWFVRGTATGLSPMVPLLDRPVSSVLDCVSPVRDLSPRFADINGDGKPELLLSDARGFIAALRNDGRGRFSLQGYLQQESAPVTVGRCAAPTMVDWNGDGRPDIVCGSEDGDVTVFENTGRGAGTLFAAGKRVVVDGAPLVARPGAGDADAPRYSWPRVADMNRDGRLDLLLGGASEEIDLYLNDGRLHAEGPVRTGGTPIHVAGIPTPTPLDMNGSGAMDIIVGSRPIPGRVDTARKPLELPSSPIVYYENAAVGVGSKPVYTKGAVLDIFLSKPNGGSPAHDAGYLLPQSLDAIDWRGTPQKQCLVMTVAGAMIFESHTERVGYPYFYLDVPPGTPPTTILPPLYSCTAAALQPGQRSGILVGTEAYGLVCYYPREAFGG
jgi:hypothetical protein